MKKIQIAFISVALLLVAISCFSFQMVGPKGKYTKESRNVGDFTAVAVSNGMEVIITQGAEYSLEIETYDNIHQYIETEVSGGKLHIYRQDHIQFSGNPDIKINITAPTLKSIAGSGGSRIIFNGEFKEERLDCAISGGGKIFGKLNLQSLNLSLSGGSRSELSGNASEVSLAASGGSKALHFDLNSQKYSIAISGGGSAQIDVSESLSVVASGGSRVKYRGTPRLSKVSTSGGSSINAD